MSKSKTQGKIQIITAVDRDAGILDVQVFGIHPNRRPLEVGNATLRMQDLPQVLPLLAERLRMEDLLVRAEPATQISKRMRSAARRLRFPLQPFSE